MSTQDLRVQFLRGTSAENEAYTGAPGELTIDTTKKLIRVHDGQTAGGDLVGDHRQWGVGVLSNPARQNVPGGTYDLYIPQRSGFYRVGSAPANRPAQDGIFSHPSGSTLIELAWGGGGDPEDNVYSNPEIYTDGNGKEWAAGNRNLLMLGGGNPETHRGPRLWQYSENFGTRSNWVHYFNNENIVGNVAHIDGRPTRSIFERGENENGQYIRFADGTQICTHTVEIPVDDIEFENYLVVDSETGAMEIRLGHQWYPATFEELYYSTADMALSLDYSFKGAGRTHKHLEAWSQPRFDIPRMPQQREFPADDELGRTGLMPIIITLFAIGRWY